MINVELTSILERIAVALERIADHFAPDEPKRERRPAILSTATYHREEKDKKTFEEFVEAAKPKG